jgi:hypothetical protein
MALAPAVRQVMRRFSAAHGWISLFCGPTIPILRQPTCEFEILGRFALGRRSLAGSPADRWANTFLNNLKYHEYHVDFVADRDELGLIYLQEREAAAVCFAGRRRS